MTIYDKMIYIIETEKKKQSFYTRVIIINTAQLFALYLVINLICKVLNWKRIYVWDHAYFEYMNYLFHTTTRSLCYLIYHIALVETVLGGDFLKRESSRGIGFLVNHCGKQRRKGQRPAYAHEIEIVPVGIGRDSLISIHARRLCNYHLEINNKRDQ